MKQVVLYALIALLAVVIAPRAEAQWAFGIDWRTATPADVRGVNLNARDSKFGATPLHYASFYNGKVVVIRALTTAGADPNARDDYGNIPLHLGVRAIRNPAAIEVLIAAGIGSRCAGRQRRDAAAYCDSV